MTLTDTSTQSEVFTIPGVDWDATIPCQKVDDDNGPRCDAEATRAMGLQHGGFGCRQPRHITLCDDHAEMVRTVFSDAWGRAAVKACTYCGQRIPTVAHMLIYDREL